MESKPSRRSIPAAKRKEKEKKGREKNQKIEKPKDVGHLVQKSQNFDFCACPSQKSVKRDFSRFQWQEGLPVVLQMHFRPD